MSQKPQRRFARRTGSLTLSAAQLADLRLLLDHCDASLTAAGQELWDYRRDLAISCQQRAQRCRIAMSEVRP